VESAFFWSIVEDARAEMGGDSELVAQGLLRRLRRLSPDEHEPFQERWEQAQGEVNRWPIRDAATLLLGLLDDDDFLSVRDWIVSHGRRTVQRVLEDADSLVELASDRHNARIDWFCGLSMDAHIGATGAPFDVNGPPGPDTPLGTPADLSDELGTRRRWPRLTAHLDDNPWAARPWQDTVG
jgi:hypothetical protein